MNKEYTRFLSFVFAHKWKAISISLLAIIQAALSTLSFLMIPQILFILDPTRDKIAFGTGSFFNPVMDMLNWMLATIENETFFNKILNIVLMMVFLFLLKNLVAYIRRIATSWLNLTVVNDIREQVFSKIQALPISEFKDQKSGHFLTLMTADVNNVLKSIRQVFDQMLTEPLNVIFMLYTVIALSWKLSIAVFIIAPITTFMIAKVGNVLKKKSKKSLEQSDRYMTMLTESFSGIKEIKAFNAEKYQLGRYLAEQIKLKILEFKQSKYQLLNMPLTEAMGSLLIGSIILTGAYLIDVDKTLTAAAFASALIGIASIIEPMKKIGHIFNEFKVAMVSAKRLFVVLDQDDPYEKQANLKTVNEFNTSIEFKNVGFKYTSGASFDISELNFSIEKGEMVALVGSSGSGKSTIADLLARFYTVTEGHILIDGVDINEINTSSLRSLITIVPQEPFLFNDSVLNNIRFNQTSKTLSEIEKAAKIANATEFISQLDNQYETLVGDRGSNLSGGQRQRIAIARAVLKDSPIIIMDEATSALDSESEMLVQSALDELLKDHTSLVIAHRLSTIINASKIIVMNEGKIVEVGTHEELLIKGGTYKNLYELQYNKD